MQDLAEREVEAWPSPTVPQPLCPTTVVPQPVCPTTVVSQPVSPPTVPQPGPPAVCQPGGQVPLFPLLANFSTPLAYHHLKFFSSLF